MTTFVTRIVRDTHAECMYNCLFFVDVFCVFFVAKGLFIFVYNVFPLGVLYQEHLQLAFDYVVIACSLKSIRPGLVQGCKAPNGVG